MGVHPITATGPFAARAFQAHAMDKPRPAAVVGVALTLIATGCARPATTAGAPEAQPSAPAATAPDQRSPGPPRIHPRWRACPDESAASDVSHFSTLPRLADTFRPVAAVRCGGGPQRRPDGGMDAVAFEDRADDVAALLAALRLPDEPPLHQPSGNDGSPELVCTLNAVAAPWLALLDAQGRWVRPGIPHDACGKPRAEVTTAVENLRWTRVATRVLGEIESAQAVTSGCDQAFADVIWMAGTDPPGRQGDLAPPADDGASVRLCLYQVAQS